MIYILGSIGAGKTSLTKILSADLNAPAYYEDVEGNGMIAKMLQKFYSAGEDSRKTTGTILQIAFLTYRYQQLKKAIMQENAIMDSSLESDFVMATQLHNNGEIDDIDYNIYVTLSQEMQSNVNGSPWNGLPDLAIYLKIDPDHEIDEIQSRGREMEDIRQKPELVAYYNRVNQAYRDWSKGYTRATMLTIDRDHLDFVNNPEHRNIVLDQIESKLVELGKLAPARYAEIQTARQITA
ncbi:MAG: deoxynucleoside kinase [Lactobacillus sp.]|jgi:deoxyadenosine/deoxycytidine kinase|uniref:Deoxynucleoside kinase n=1 Tax=Lacticaseibacillus suilingensis TaxID=2799577 RepID=A0ABW4BH78_9LACO|nr:deoxynucleoside kinase [Lacticaseibacillus suilingensis]MCI1894061.1 deoxynucleoside kinase [Lactobacillus sp.]MCI1917150.1 deoxynucleoside kinase [Lactobacillus sp.]MCI1942006.1 deoxynucleoside kinase [Lactobacillus sp.]MCI1972387.1 deoxynucleoside kinase [Lactobacillus sp.]MCI2016745.1 deoxynucleoside kinase [Lactobacillus sp.]